MALLRFVVAHYSFLILLAFVSYLIGYRLTQRIPYDSIWEEVSISTSLGLGIIGYLVFVLGILGLLYRSVLLLTIGACVVASYPVPVLVGRRIWPKLKGASLAAYALVATGCITLFVPILVLPLFPPIQFDSTFYFLASAKIYAQRHGLVFTPYLRFPVLTQLNEMFFTLALILYDDIAAQLIQFLMLLLLLLALVGFGRRAFSRQVGWWSAALLLANPLVLWSGVVAYVDISLMFFSTLAAYTFWNWFHSRERHWLLLAGAFCGFAASTKYPGLFFPLLFGLVTIYVAIRERKYSIPVVFAAAAFVVGGPWYIRNIYYTRNPVFPFLGKIFGYNWWTPEDLQGLLVDMQMHGVGRSLKSLLLLPWSLAFNQDVFFSQLIHLSKLPFLALPLMVVFVIKDVRVRKIAGLVLAFTLFWFFSSQILRYLLPMIPALSVATAASLDMLLGWSRFTRGWRAKWPVIVVLSVLFISEGWLYSVYSWQENGPVPVTRRQRDSYLTHKLPSYPAYKLMNSLSGRNYTLYAIYDENMAYFVDGSYKGDYFGPARYAPVLAKLADGEALYRELKSLGADYFLVNNQRFKITLPQDNFFKENFKLIYPQGSILLFDLGKGALPLSEGHQLLLNPGFENLTEGWPSGWMRAGNPLIDTSGQYSHSGSSAVRCSGAENVFFQVVEVKPGTTYQLSFKARSVDGRQQPARVQVNWSDRAGQFLSTDLQVINVGKSWYPYGAVITAPPQSASAVIYAACHEQGSVWMDDFSFSEFQPAGNK